ncbi:MAG: zinc ribbon domain-containing protein [Gemmatimonadota bacterium]|nr:zinc ribbon domain-containing protein [Gemmatimonadota bacterium]MDH5804760.1 zinc ribbon domain-containing protein [Gemmatimonadota bacterium]
MDEVELFFRQLVSVLSESSPERLNAPIQISEIYQSVLPYRHYRSALGIDTMDDYDMVLLKLLAGEGGFVTIDPPEVQTTLQEESSSVNPNPGAFRDFAAANIYLNSGAVRTVTEAGDDYAPPADEEDDDDDFSFGSPSSDVEFISKDSPVTATPSLSLEPPSYEPKAQYELPPKYDPPPRDNITPFEGTPSAMPPMLTRPESSFSKKETGCVYCGGSFPTNRDVSFCPHCGKSTSQPECSSCGAEIEEGWQYCIDCGAGLNS